MCIKPIRQNFQISINKFIEFFNELVRNERLVSSARWWTLQNFIALCKSFIYSKTEENQGQIPVEHHMK